MTSEWIFGVFTALGALLGAGATLTSGLIGNRTQRGLAAASRKAQIAEARREAYAAYLTAAMSECSVAHRSYLGDWERRQPTYAPVLIAGPGQIEESAEVLRFCLGDLSDKCDRWYEAHRNGRKLPNAENVLDAQLAARDARLKFASAARDHVYG